MREDSSAALRLAALAAALLAPLGLARAMTVRPVNIEEMAARADRIFVGRCAGVESASHPDLRFRVTRASFDVEQVLKGPPQARASFTRIGSPGSGGSRRGAGGFQGDSAGYGNEASSGGADTAPGGGEAAPDAGDASSGLGDKDSLGMPRIGAGDEVVVFLYGESALGLSSPVGLGQGRFKIFRDKDGKRYVRNDFGNRFLLRGLSAEARERLGDLAEGPLPSSLPLETLVEMVRRLLGRDPIPVGHPAENSSPPGSRPEEVGPPGTSPSGTPPSESGSSGTGPSGPGAKGPGPSESGSSGTGASGPDPSESGSSEPGSRDQAPGGGR